jgi:hypothetical protein
MQIAEYPGTFEIQSLSQKLFKGPKSRTKKPNAAIRLRFVAELDASCRMATPLRHPFQRIDSRLLSLTMKDRTHGRYSGL